VLTAAEVAARAKKKADAKGEEARTAVEKKEAAYAAELAASSNRIRETAKWLVATFGAVAGALIVGLQLSDIGELEGSDRGWASVSAGAALVAVIVIIALAARVLARGRVPLHELSSNGSYKFKGLREVLNRNPTLFAGYKSVEVFVDRVQAEYAKQVDCWNRSQDEKLSETERRKATDELEEATGNSRELNRLSTRLMATARAEDVRMVFSRARDGIVALAILVVIAAICFAGIDNAPDGEETAALPQRPTAAKLHLTKTGQEKLGSILGTECDPTKVPVEVLSTSEEGVSDVVSVAAEGCAAARMTIEADDGEFEPVESAPLPTGSEALLPSAAE
jgi:hypothetical protein